MLSLLLVMESSVIFGVRVKTLLIIGCATVVTVSFYSDPKYRSVQGLPLRKQRNDDRENS